MANPLQDLSQIMLPKIEDELKMVVNLVKDSRFDELFNMMGYHLGWEVDGKGAGKPGKRIRPLILLLANSAAGGEWENALPAAAAVELVHNFSLIHDDIQDNSPLRRGRPTVWKHWGIPQAINAGDTMFTLANIAILRLKNVPSETTILRATNSLMETCLKLTQGQFLDISYEKIQHLDLKDYWHMIARKTAALITTSVEIGPIIAGVDVDILEKYRLFGYETGLAFQIQDDLLGIWGEAALTGKSTESDLVSGKKSLPILYGIKQNGAFAKRWFEGPISSDEISEIAKQLESEGAMQYCQEQTRLLTKNALRALDKVHPTQEAGEALVLLNQSLLDRSF
jgi:geranylgeranyl diphosphate synthase type I